MIKFKLEGIVLNLKKNRNFNCNKDTFNIHGAARSNNNRDRATTNKIESETQKQQQRTKRNTCITQ